MFALLLNSNIFKRRMSTKADRKTFNIREIRGILKTDMISMII